ncbi:glycosyl transferase [Herbiconiux sp. KACC 21604]|uniref:glycosyltransferase n=1 Tax=unclassified Herbiconiux TaxID=2618217 RepID=UPI001492ABD5|nr:nucleotide disphospho-sugar-binding domain-containing protein [Herbiconiux sp. SALV-R1]QJU54293.1 glycosyl transferase [Herbiconiux sp. SALV-R1]WPO85361.1 glycosyl transferase [Herbiconiux sp. KACC 21604]
MASLLLPSSPIYGHLAPMVTVARGLQARGHEATILSGRKYRELVESHGIRFVALPAEVDYDDADLDAWLPGRDRFSGLAAVRYDLIGMFAKPIPGQHRALTAELARHHYDAVVSEGVFMGALPTLLTVPAADRIPFIGVSALPLTLTSVDTAPFGPALAPGDSPLSRLRNRMLNAVIHAGPLKPIQIALEKALAEVGAPAPKGNFFDQPVRFDQTLQLSPAGIEYTRRELPGTVHFVGPLRPERRAGAQVPTWWSELDGSRPVVHVTQGTIDNTDLGKLVAPTISGLASEHVLVVAATGGRPIAELERLFPSGLPENARVAEFLPYDLLLPKTSVVVCNGGFGGVQQALSHGIPLVVAGATEDKPEVAARVAWSGAGVNLRTGRPAAADIRSAVGRALREPSFRIHAVRLQNEIAALGDPLDSIARTVDDEIAARARA